MNTAVEWLINEIKKEFGLSFSDNITTKAKAMEKQQIIDSVCQHDIRNHGIVSSIGILKSVKQAEQYYNETFKTDKDEKRHEASR